MRKNEFIRKAHDNRNAGVSPRVLREARDLVTTSVQDARSSLIHCSIDVLETALHLLDTTYYGQGITMRRIITAELRRRARGAK